MTTEWIVALGTFVLAVVAIIAIFQDKIRAWLLHPVLVVSSANYPPDSHKTRMEFDRKVEFGRVTSVKETDVYYVRLKIENKGNSKAEDVEVFAANLSRQQADESFRVVENFMPMNLGWSHLGVMFFPAISPGTYKHCDLFHVIDPKNRSNVPYENTSWPNIPVEKTILSFDTIVKPFTMGYLQPFGTYHLDILVAAANSKPIRKTLEIHLTGEWYDDERKMLGEGVGVKIL